MSNYVKYFMLLSLCSFLPATGHAVNSLIRQDMADQGLPLRPKTKSKTRYTSACDLSLKGLYTDRLESKPLNSIKSPQELSLYLNEFGKTQFEKMLQRLFGANNPVQPITLSNEVFALLPLLGPDMEYGTYATVYFHFLSSNSIKTTSSIYDEVALLTYYFLKAYSSEYEYEDLDAYLVETREIKKQFKRNHNVVEQDFDGVTQEAAAGKLIVKSLPLSLIAQTSDEAYELNISIDASLLNLKQLLIERSEP